MHRELNSRFKYILSFLRYEKLFSFSIFGTCILIFANLFPFINYFSYLLLIFLLGYSLVKNRFSFFTLTLCFVILIFSILFFRNIEKNDLDRLKLSCQQKCEVSAKIQDYSICLTQYCTVKISEVEIDGEQFSGNFGLVVYSTKLINLQNWDRIRFTSKFQAFESDDLSYYHTIGYLGEFIFPSKVESLPSNQNYFSREYFSKYISEVSIKYLGKDSDLVDGIVFGSKDFYTTNKTLIQNLGLSHIFVVSGFNLTVMILFLFSFAVVLKRKWILLLGVLFSFLYMFIIGFDNVPSLRAFIFISVFSLSQFFNFRISKLSLLALSVFVLHIFIPFSIFQISFQLTFLALAGIIFCSKDFTRLFSRIFPRYISESFGVTFSAQIFVTPIIVLNFGVLAPFTLISTLFVMSMVEIITVFGLIFYLFSFIPLLGSFLAFILLQWVAIFNVVINFLNNYFFQVQIPAETWIYFSILVLICLIFSFETKYRERI